MKLLSFIFVLATLTSAHADRAALAKVGEYLDECSRSCSERCIKQAERLIEDAQLVLNNCGQAGPSEDCIAAVKKAGLPSSARVILCNNANRWVPSCIKSLKTAEFSEVSSYEALCKDPNGWTASCIDAVWEQRFEYINTYKELCGEATSSMVQCIHRTGEQGFTQGIDFLRECRPEVLSPETLEWLRSFDDWERD